ncbi:hypothetical protein ACPYO6_06515 [Georgenia sp. Z1344]|uniref:hypothetical protein n=1 Tax=Georgenia sp. Z1344 TaxID=3416706 RepID=UPI003CF01ED0
MHPALTWLAPRPAPPPPLLRWGDGHGLVVRTPLPGDGHALPSGWDPVDGREGQAGQADLLAGLERAARAGEAAPDLIHGQALCLASAAWVHVGGRPPSVMDTARAPGMSIRARHRLVLREEDVVRMHGIVLTTPGRTAVDLLRRASLSDAVGPARALLRGREAAAAARLLVLERSRLPGMRRAGRLLALLLTDLGHPSFVPA